MEELEKRELGATCDLEAVTEAVAHITMASIALRTVGGTVGPVAEASARELDRFASAVAMLA